jgi:DNA-binding transcriptional MocR family regulator
MTISETSVADWRPDLSDAGDPAYAQIAEAISADVARGVLAAGARLPTQRALAERLGIGVGTVTRAYAEAEGRGLIEAVVGRGSFVARRPSSQADGDGAIDLSRNVAPLDPARAAVRGAVAAVARRGDLAQRLDYPPDGGFEADRRAGALWLARAANFADADPRRLIMTAGAQQAITAALAAACRPGEALVVEAATWHGIKTAAAHAGLRLVPAAMDAEGLTPAGLDRAIAESGARAAYVQPFQNPTARVMGLARRQAIVETAVRRGVVLIEDDLYGPIIAELGLPPLAQLAPEQVAYVSGLAKSVAPGLRTGFLIPPDRLRSGCLEALWAVAFGSPGLGGVVATQLIEHGEAFEILDAIRVELARRTELAMDLLAGLVEPLRQPASPHLWAPASELDAERVAGEALRAGVLLTPPRAPFVDGAPVSGLRICLGAADAASLRRGLAILKEALQPGRGFAGNVV